MRRFWQIPSLDTVEAFASLEKEFGVVSFQGVANLFGRRMDG
jgi:hypothetical protein